MFMYTFCVSVISLISGEDESDFCSRLYENTRDEDEESSDDLRVIGLNWNNPSQQILKQMKK